MQLHAALGAVFWLVASACSSCPDPRLRPDLVARIQALPSPHFRAHLSYVAGEGDVPGAGEEALAEVRELLSASPWFDTLEADRAEASLLLSIHPVERTVYYETPAHSLAAMLLALVVPMPWRLKAGYRMIAALPGTGTTVEVDTRRESTAITWSLAPLLNVSPDRSFLLSAERELARIHAQLLPLVDPEPSARGSGAP